jgi:very-short-patch-repair endonuclease
MHARQPVPELLVQLASLQAGVVSREQALGHGVLPNVLKRLVRTGSWERLSSGIYTLAPGRVSWEGLAWAGVLIGGDHTRLGGRAAWHLHGLADSPPDTISLLVPATRDAPQVQGPWAFKRERPGVRPARTVGSPPRLGVEDTLLDLLAEASHEEVVHLVTAAVQQRRTDARRLRAALSRRRLVPHRGLLTDLLAEVEAGVRSPLERSYLRDVERAHGLPVGRRQASRRNTETDVLYEDYGLLVELDGRLGHDGLGRFRDMRRDNVATTDGLATLRYGHRDVYGEPCAVAWQVADNLTLRGWTGLLTRCPRCRLVSDIA